MPFCKIFVEILFTHQFEQFNLIASFGRSAYRLCLGDLAQEFYFAYSLGGTFYCYYHVITAIKLGLLKIWIKIIAWLGMFEKFMYKFRDASRSTLRTSLVCYKNILFPCNKTRSSFISSTKILSKSRRIHHELDRTKETNFSAHKKDKEWYTDILIVEKQEAFHNLSLKIIFPDDFLLPEILFFSNFLNETYENTKKQSTKL